MYIGRVAQGTGRCGAGRYQDLKENNATKMVGLPSFRLFSIAHVLPSCFSVCFTFQFEKEHNKIHPRPALSFNNQTYRVVRPPHAMTNTAYIRYRPRDAPSALLLNLTYSTSKVRSNFQLSFLGQRTSLSTHRIPHLSICVQLELRFHGLIV